MPKGKPVVKSKTATKTKPGSEVVVENGIKVAAPVKAEMPAIETKPKPEVESKVPIKTVDNGWRTNPILLTNQEVLSAEEPSFGWQVLQEMKVIPFGANLPPNQTGLLPREYYTQYILSKLKLGYLAELFLPRTEALSIALDLKNNQLITYYVQTNPPLSRMLLEKCLFNGPEIIKITQALIFKESARFRTLKSLPTDAESLSLLLKIFDANVAAVQHVLHVGSSLTLSKMQLKPIWKREMEKEAPIAPEIDDPYDPPPPSLELWRKDGVINNPLSLKLLLDSGCPSWVAINSEMAEY